MVDAPATEATGTATDSAATTGAAATATANGAPSNDEATKLLASFKEAGLDNPAGALDLIKELRTYERGEKLPVTVAKRLADLEAAAKAAEDAKLSDSEKLQKRIDELEAKDKANEERASKMVRDTAIVTAARAVGAIDPEAMPALIDPDSLDIDAKSGQPTNLKELLTTLKKDKPMWFGEGGPGSFDQGPRGNSDGPVDMNARLRAASGRG